MSMVPTMIAGLTGSSNQSRLSAKPPRKVEMGRTLSFNGSRAANSAGMLRRSRSAKRVA